MVVVVRLFFHSAPNLGGNRSLLTGGCYLEVVVSTGLTVLQIVSEFCNTLLIL